MSAAVLAGHATDHGSTSTQITMRVTTNPQLADTFVGIHAAGSPFSGTYSPSAKSASLLVSQAEFDALSSNLANGAQISISITYEDATNVVTRFCFPAMCVPA
ncbi:MAG TPA: hypothetical protein VIV60_14110 [Polyangiaceae bacterium]